MTENQEETRQKIMKEEDEDRELCENCGKPKGQHTVEVTRKNRKDVEIIYCHSIDELKRKEVDWDTYLNKKFKHLKDGKPRRNKTKDNERRRRR